MVNTSELLMTFAFAVPLTDDTVDADMVIDDTPADVTTNVDLAWNIWFVSVDCPDVICAVQNRSLSVTAPDVLNAREIVTYDGLPGDWSWNDPATKNSNSAPRENADDGRSVLLRPWVKNCGGMSDTIVAGIEL
jgi:hypothetical protein